MQIVLIGCGSYANLIYSKYKLFDNIKILGIISRDINKRGKIKDLCFFTSIKEFLEVYNNISEIYFELCIPSDDIFDYFKELINQNVKNFIFPKTFTKCIEDINKIKHLKEMNNLNIIIASQWFYSDILKRINKIITYKKGIKEVKSIIIFKHNIDNDRRKHYRISNTLLPHQIHILIKSGLLINNMDSMKFEIIKQSIYEVHFKISQFVNNVNYFVEIINQINSVYNKEKTLVIYIDEKEVINVDFNNFGKDFLNKTEECDLKEKFNENKRLDPLENMIENYMCSKNNIEIFYEMEELIHIIDKELSKNNILVIGAGIFGCLITKKLSECNYNITILDKSSNLLQGASCVNQCRIHRGYHYPRDDTIVEKLKRDKEEFNDLFREAIVFDSQHYYCISKENSKTSKEKYISFLNKNNLDFIEKNPEFIKINNIVSCFKVAEHSFDIYKMREIISDYIYKSNIYSYFSSNIVCINVLDNERFKVIWRVNNDIYCNIYRYIINSTYEGINLIHNLVNSNVIKNQIYQYELVEIFVIEPINEWKKNKYGIGIMDGPFSGIMTFGFNNNLYILYDVELSVLETVIDELPRFKKTINEYNEDKYIRFNKIIQKMSYYFPEVIQSKLIDSMYQTRIILPNVDETDKRPTMILNPINNFWSLFSGKIINSVSAANDILDNILNKSKII
jgi:hypothetical protein